MQYKTKNIKILQKKTSTQPNPPKTKNQQLPIQTSLKLKKLKNTNSPKNK